MKPNRANHHRKAKHPRAPYDWYVEPEWAVDALIGEVSFSGLIYDPACGKGTIPKTFARHGFETHASDIVDRGYPGARQLDFLGAASSAFRVPNVVSNPPFSYQDGIAEAFVRRALQIATDRVAVFVRLKWLGSLGRYQLFEIDHPPELVLVFSDRPSCPPGPMIEGLGERAFRGGEQDFMWVVWRKGHVGDTVIRWIVPRPEDNRKARRRG